MDETLRRVNSDYDAKRFKDMALRRPIVRNIHVILSFLTG